MPEDFSDLENELRQLRPRTVAPAFVERVERELAAAPTEPRPAYFAATSWRSWKWAAWSVAAAAGLVLAAVYRNADADPSAAFTPSTDVAAADVYKPVSADKLLTGEAEERITLPDGTPARRLRAQFVDTITWENPRTKASVRWSVPREEVRVVPVVLQ